MPEPVESYPQVEGVANKKSRDPELGMEFESDEEAFQFYNGYAQRMGFRVRKQNVNYLASGLVRSRKFTCSLEGFVRKKFKGRQVKYERQHNRTGCPSHMHVKRTRNGTFCVFQFEVKHNHPLGTLIMAHMLRSKKASNSARAMADSGRRYRMRPKAPFSLLSKQDGVRCSLNSPPIVHKNYLRTKRKTAIRPGDAAAVMQYLQEKQADNPRFYYGVQLDEDDQITNIFWADGRSLLEYEHFGDVICFDTAYKSNGYGRPFAYFTGVNHHKQTIIFAAALIYDETVETFRWLFETFKHAMNGKQPQVILTDQDEAISNAIVALWPGTIHRLCVWHMYQNATKHLSHVFMSKNFKHVLSTCMYDYEDEEDFLSAWKKMLEEYDLTGNIWLTKLFEIREKWALPYGRQTFCADIKSTQQNECLNKVFKTYLSLEQDLMTFFEHYERLVKDKRYKEFEADFHASQTIPKVPHSMLLKQAATIYTPSVYEVFRKEYDLFVDCTVYSCGVDGTVSGYKITNEATGKTSIVRFDSSEGNVTCTCKKFEFAGVQCCHVLKLLDYRNIKTLPQHYFLKRWRKDAKVVLVSENQNFLTSTDPKVAMANRYNSLGRIYNQIVARASECENAYQIAIRESIELVKKVEQALEKRSDGIFPVSTSHDDSLHLTARESPLTLSLVQSQDLILSGPPITASPYQSQDPVVGEPSVSPCYQQSQMMVAEKSVHQDYMDGRAKPQKSRGTKKKD